MTQDMAIHQVGQRAVSLVFSYLSYFAVTG